jgi:hypothetical protein
MLSLDGKISLHFPQNTPKSSHLSSTLAIGHTRL